MKEYIVHAPKDNPCAVEKYTSFYGEPIEELVRCKDCKYWPYQLLPYSENTAAYSTYLHCFDFKSDGYCSLGRRKEE